MSDETENEQEEARAKKKDDSGEGDSDSWGRGKAGAGAGGIRLPTAKETEVKAARQYFDIKAVVGVLAEFLSHLPMKVSANVSVAWDNTKSKSFAVVNWLIDLAKLPEFSLEKTRASVAASGQQAMQKQKPKQTRGVSPSMNFGPTGPTGSQ